MPLVEASVHAYPSSTIAVQATSLSAALSEEPDLHRSVSSGNHHLLRKVLLGPAAELGFGFLAGQRAAVQAQLLEVAPGAADVRAGW